MHWLLILLVAIPAIEIGTFIWIGNIIGGWWVAILILLTGLFGITIARKQGLSTWKDAQNAMQAGISPKEQILDSLGIFAGAILLFIPGFITDILGLLFLFPWTRNIFKVYILKRIMKRMSHRTIIYRK